MDFDYICRLFEFYAILTEHIGRNPRFDREQHWAEFGDIGQTFETLGRHWADIGDIGQTFGRHWADIGKTCGRHWADIRQTL